MKTRSLRLQVHVTIVLTELSLLFNQLVVKMNSFTMAGKKFLLIQAMALVLILNTVILVLIQRI